MRYLTILFLFIQSLTFGQVAAMLMVPSGGAAPTYLLDDYPADAAYSLRLLKADQIDSAAIRVRRDSDNAEQNIGFTSEGYLDTASLKTFVGANSGYVVTWYDQSGNGNDATQSTASNQPRIVNAGTVERVDGHVAIYHNDNEFLVTATLSTVSQPTTRIAVGKFDTTGNYFVDGVSLRQSVGGQAGTSNALIFSGTFDPYTGGLDTNKNLYYALFNGASSQLYINGTGLGVKSVGTQGYDGSTIGARTGGISNLLNGYNLEIINYTSDQSANRTSIESNINTHYSIY